MPEKVGKEQIMREPGFLYFVTKEGNVERAPMKGKEGKREVISKTPVKIEKGFMYFLGKSGFVERAPRKGRQKKEDKK